ncbi:P-loop containing nucleoside triphosphate hydrolase protein [Kickxella alabastrina]|uniref:P-loop containing nucleoside triphosphate hydrolase protein n=1 Tax=Kickxella alabastrina TaxID=61397 RepID=UPI002220CCA5|nr:P-loop containing nucleoside triphosphate hydrolase protein [Kickxella alabastrina]KAI7827794.1 P-loop containing nucleoside triphosphate hydrolase protein [Kickxella alabastrina]
MRVQETYSEFPVRAVIVMGVSGSGKSTVGARLAQQLGNAPFIDADSLHPPANIALMKSGTALTDSNRWPWLKLVREEIEKKSKSVLASSDASSNRSAGGEARDERRLLYVVCACSALKRSYRELLSRGDPGLGWTHDTVFVFVDVSKRELSRRLALRAGHFMDPALLDSQLETLEAPSVTREAAVVVHGDGAAVDEVVADAWQQIRGYVSKNSL